MPSGLDIEAGMYLEEPVRTRVGVPGAKLGARDVWRKQTRQPSAYSEFGAIATRGADYAKFRCNWCGSAQTIQLNRETAGQCCPNCGGPR